MVPANTLFGLALSRSALPGRPWWDSDGAVSMETGMSQLFPAHINVLNIWIAVVVSTIAVSNKDRQGSRYFMSNVRGTL